MGTSERSKTGKRCWFRVVVGLLVGAALFIAGYLLRPLIHHQEEAAKGKWTARIVADENSPGDVPPAKLVVYRDGQNDQAWDLTSVWNYRWSAVELRRTEARGVPTWTADWRCGSGTGFSSYSGLVAWVSQGRPRFWQNQWSRTEIHNHPSKGYEYTYRTEVLTTPSGQPWLRVRVEHIPVSAMKSEFRDNRFLCAPAKRREDGTVDFHVLPADRRVVEELLKVDYLSGIYPQLHEFLGQTAAQETDAGAGLVDPHQ